MTKCLSFTIREQKMSVGPKKGQKVYIARPTDRQRVTHRQFCEEVAHATTFTGAEVEAVLRLAAEMAKKHVESGESVDFGDIGTLSPSFKSKAVDHIEDFNATRDIKKPMVKLRPSVRYFTLEGVTYERVEPKAKKTKGNKPSGGGTQSHP